MENEAQTTQSTGRNKQTDMAAASVAQVLHSRAHICAI